MFKFAPPRSAQARRLKRQAKGIVAPSALTETERARLVAMLAAAQASQANAAGHSSVSGPPQPNEALRGPVVAATQIPGMYGGLPAPQEVPHGNN